jgi:hypothetical protein
MEQAGPFFYKGKAPEAEKKILGGVEIQISTFESTYVTSHAISHDISGCGPGVFLR